MWNVTLNGHKYWNYTGKDDVIDGDEVNRGIYWTNETSFDSGHWIISGAGELQRAAFDDDIGDGLYADTPPLNGSWNWTIYNSSSFDDGKSLLVTVQAMSCSLIEPIPCVNIDPFCVSMAAQ